MACGHIQSDHLKLSARKSDLSDVQRKRIDEMEEIIDAIEKTKLEADTEFIRQISTNADLRRTAVASHRDVLRRLIEKYYSHFNKFIYEMRPADPTNEDVILLNNVLKNYVDVMLFQDGESMRIIERDNLRKDDDVREKKIIEKIQAEKPGLFTPKFVHNRRQRQKVKDIAETKKQLELERQRRGLAIWRELYPTHGRTIRQLFEKAVFSIVHEGRILFADDNLFANSSSENVKFKLQNELNNFRLAIASAYTALTDNPIQEEDRILVEISLASLLSQYHAHLNELNELQPGVKGAQTEISKALEKFYTVDNVQANVYGPAWIESLTNAAYAIAQTTDVLLPF